MDVSTIILAVLVVAALALAMARDPGLPLEGLRASGRLLRGVWVELLLGFLLAGLIDVLVAPATIARWLGAESGPRGILIAWAAGLALPGGPYLLFPLVARLLASGAGVGALITLVSAKVLVSPVRMLTYEAPLVGWDFTVARLVPGLVAPPLLGIAGQWLHRLLVRPPVP